MLALTRKTDYALIALSFLVGQRAEGGGPVSAKRIAETFGLPLPLLMNILKELVQARLLNSARGPRGGYGLAVEPKELTLLEVVTALEGPMRLTPCVDRLPVLDHGCELYGRCPIRGTVQSLHDRIRQFLGDMTLQDLYDDRVAPACTHGSQDDQGAKSCACRDNETNQPFAAPRQTA
jgi:Rrf2 family protein